MPFNSIAGKVHPAGYFFIGKVFTAAEQIGFLLLRRQLSHRFIDQPEVVFFMQVIFCDISRCLRPFILIGLFFCQLPEIIQGLISAKPVQIGLYIIDVPKQVPFGPYLHKCLLDNFLRCCDRPGDPVYIIAQVLMVSIEKM
jgi:hypothetical protein